MPTNLDAALAFEGVSRNMQAETALFRVLDGPALDVASVAAPRWQRFAGGRRLAHVGYRRRVIRVALGTIGTALVGGALVLGDGRTLSGAVSSFGAVATELTREATSTSESAAQVASARWGAPAAWARIDAAARRQSPDVQALGIDPPTITTPPRGPTSTREVSSSAGAATRDRNTAGVPPGLADPSITSASTPGANNWSTERAIVGGATPVAGAAQASPTIGAPQPAGTQLPVVTATPGVPVPTATALRLAPSATPQRAAPTIARPVGTVSHQVVAGDTLWGIATRYGTSVDAILRANRLADPDSIVPGVRLVIPR